MRDFDKAFQSVIGIEGGYVNDPHDPGGETKFGICKRSYPDEEIANLTIDCAKEIYKRDYWDKVHGDELPSPLNLFVFDAAVNQGVEPAIVMLQKAVGAIQDGVIGSHTIAAAQAAGNEHAALFMAARAVRYFGTRNADTYITGWLKRLFVISMGA